MVGLWHVFQNLSKQIRDQLHIKKNVNNFNIYAPHKRGSYIGAPHPSGTLRKSISYQQHSMEVEPIINARTRFFKKRNICYRWLVDCLDNISKEWVGYTYVYVNQNDNCGLFTCDAPSCLHNVWRVHEPCCVAMCTSEEKWLLKHIWQSAEVISAVPW